MGEGGRGEEIAAQYLQKKGYELLRMNYHCRYGEIDIVMKDGEYVVFVEVKLRKNADVASAMEFVTNQKQRKIKTTAQAWLANSNSNLQPRFDVIEIYAPNGSHMPLTINHLDNAFY